jgi:hypothetical protein
MLKKLLNFRLSLYRCILIGCVAVLASPVAIWGQEAVVEDGIAWRNVEDWGVEGKGWEPSETARYYDRLPAKAEGAVRSPVWSLSRHSAGMCVRFETDATSMRLRYSLLSGSLAMPHMPATGVSGFDLYGQDDQGRWRWINVVKPTAQTADVQLVYGLDPGPRAYAIYFPLYNGVESLEIGVAEGASFTPLAPREEKPIVYYGTSIAHGACSSRPGIAFPSILGRRFDLPVINLGFSGNGKMEPEVGALLAEIDPAVYCIDCLPNMEGSEVEARAADLIQQLRTARPDTPILMIEDRTYANAAFMASKRERHTKSRAAFRAAYEELIAEGVEGLTYIEGDNQLGDDDEATTDGSHPSDLGMMRMADFLTPYLEEVLGE